MRGSNVSPWVSRNSCTLWVPISCSHTHKCSLFIGQYLPGCRTGPPANAGDVINEGLSLQTILTNKQWTFVGVATTSWYPTGAGLSMVEHYSCCRHCAVANFDWRHAIPAASTENRENEDPMPEPGSSTVDRQLSIATTALLNATLYSGVRCRQEKLALKYNF